jgi:DNA invertase Pin-like site-specific DNA recombinase
MTEGKRAVIWKAVSSEQQARDDLQSLTYQETLAREWCEKHGYTVTTVLDLPGHSRSESDVITALEELAAEGCFAYHDLRRMWQQQAFDILIVHTIDRLARSKSLFIWVVENVIKSGAEIYFSTPGVMFNRGNVDYTAPMALMGLRSSLDAFFEKSAATKAAKLAHGIPVQGKKPFGFITLYDERHRPCGLQVDESQRALLDDAAKLVLEGVSLRKIEEELYSRFGHNRNGKPYPQNFFRNVFYNPWTWGHASRGHSDNTRKGGQVVHHWLFDGDVTIPEHITIHWNTHTPLYTGDVADRLKEEFRRRRLVVGGKGTAQAKPFTGLVVCHWCGAAMVHSESHNAGMRCQTNARRNRKQDCPKPSARFEWVSENRVHDYMQQVLDGMLERDSPVLENDSQPDTAGQLQRVRDEINTKRQEVMNLITRAASSASVVGDLFQSQIDERTQRIEALESQRVRLETKLATRHPKARADAFEDLKQHRDTFWQQPAGWINRTLHALLGNIRLVVKDNRVTGRVTV